MFSLNSKGEKIVSEEAIAQFNHMFEVLAVPDPTKKERKILGASELVKFIYFVVGERCHEEDIRILGLLRMYAEDGAKYLTQENFLEFYR